MTAWIIAGVAVIIALHVFYALEIERLNRQHADGQSRNPEKEEGDEHS